MVNALRTLLLNVSGAQQYDLPGEEYVPPDFRPRELPTYLALPRRVLLGTDPDRLHLNYRLCQLMTLLHSCELEEYVLALDDRVTYWPFSDDLFRTAFQLLVRQLAGETTELFVTGQSAAADGTGRLQRRWMITQISNSEVEIVREWPSFLQTTSPYTVANELTSQISLPGSSLQVRFQPPETANASWQVTAHVRPVVELGELLVPLRQQVGEANLLRLFGTAPVEPYLTFRNLWEKHQQLAYQLGGLVLALGYRINDLPVRGV